MLHSKEDLIARIAILEQEVDALKERNERQRIRLEENIKDQTNTDLKIQELKKDLSNEPKNIILNLIQYITRKEFKTELMDYQDILRILANFLDSTET